MHYSSKIVHEKNNHFTESFQPAQKKEQIILSNYLFFCSCRSNQLIIFSWSEFSRLNPLIWASDTYHKLIDHLEMMGFLLNQIH